MAFQDVSQEGTSGPYLLRGEHVLVGSGPWESEAIATEKSMAQDKEHSQNQTVGIPANGHHSGGTTVIAKGPRAPCRGTSITSA